MENKILKKFSVVFLASLLFLINNSAVISARRPSKSRRSFSKAVSEKRKDETQGGINVETVKAVEESKKASMFLENFSSSLPKLLERNDSLAKLEDASENYYRAKMDYYSLFAELVLAMMSLSEKGGSDRELVSHIRELEGCARESKEIMDYAFNSMQTAQSSIIGKNVSGNVIKNLRELNF
ncbi:MAG: hypothetical protein LBK29_02670 [Oscillospiraceae bacterium]|nr:hypothetical protein [Oscillospiraceae bacterium]